MEKRLKFVNNPPYRDWTPTANQSGEVIKPYISEISVTFQKNSIGLRQNVVVAVEKRDLDSNILSGGPVNNADSYVLLNTGADDFWYQNYVWAVISENIMLKSWI